MSALFPTPHEELGEVHDGETLVAPTPLVVRRRAGLAALIAAAASAVAIAYLWRASQTMTAVDWSLCAVMAMVAAYYLTTLVDARNPLAVADELGVRIRLGDEWRGLPWDGIRQVSIHPRRGPLRDGRIVFAPHTLARVVDGLEGRAKRHAALNQKLYGAALAVPVGVMTRVSTTSEHSVVEQIAGLSLGRVDVIEVAKPPGADPTERAEPAERAEPVEPILDSPALPDSEPRQEAISARGWKPKWTRTKEKAAATAQPEVEADEVSTTGEPVESARTSDPIGPDRVERAPRRRMVGGFATIVSRVRKSPQRDHDSEPVEASLEVAEPAESPPPDDGLQPDAPDESLPLRATRRALRAEVTRTVPATLGDAGSEAEGEEDSPMESRELRRPGNVNLVIEPPAPGVDATRVRPISQMGDPVEPLVIDDFATEPAYDPVIGPELTAARTRLGLSVDELAERTRIRPHVIESIEVDDFAPCGGDFYARGHLRTLARFLGQDAAPFLAAFEDRYATAPVNARRVFEAELATGVRGSMRGTSGGPNWGLLVGAVLSLILVWGVVRFVSAEPVELVRTPAPVLNGSAGLATDPEPGDAAQVSKPLRLSVVAAHSDSRLVVRNGNGRVVFTGELALGEKKRLEVVPPVRVRATDAGALEVAVGGRDEGVLGVLGQPGNRTFR